MWLKTNKKSSFFNSSLVCNGMCIYCYAIDVPEGHVFLYFWQKIKYIFDVRIFIFGRPKNIKIAISINSFIGNPALCIVLLHTYSVPGISLSHYGRDHTRKVTAGNIDDAPPSCHKTIPVLSLVSGTLGSCPIQYAKTGKYITINNKFGALLWIF